MRSLAFTIPLILALVGCGSTSGTPPERPSGSVSGVVFQGPITGATVRAYGFNEGRRGALLGEGLTDSSGRYSINAVLPDGVVLLEASGGAYREEASGRDVTVGPSVPLRSLVRVSNAGATSGGTIGTFTTIAAGLAERLIASGRTPATATDEAYGAINTALGLDARAVTPLDITNVSNAGPISAGLEYGFFEAAVSQWTADAGTRNGTLPHTVHTSTSLLTLAHDDVRTDGVLDGRGTGGALRVGDIALATNTYRHELALALLRIARSAANRTGLTSDQLLNAATRWNDSAVSIFGSAAVRPISSSAPTLLNLQPARDTRVRGQFTATVQAEDAVGLTQVSIGLDTTNAGNAADLSQPAVQINSASFADGAHTLYAEARNVVGGVARTEHRVYVDNTAPSVTKMQPENNDVVRNTFTASASVSDAQMGTSVFLLDNVTLGNQGSATSPRYTLDTRNYSTGTHTITLRATDSAGNVTTVSRSVYFLNGFSF